MKVFADHARGNSGASVFAHLRSLGPHLPRIRSNSSAEDPLMPQKTGTSLVQGLRFEGACR